MNTLFILTNLKTINITYITMKKVFSVICKLFVWTIVGLFSAMFTLAFIIGIVEGDLSHGLFYYLQ